MSEQAGKDSSVIRWGILGTGAAAQAFAEDLHRLPDARLAAVGSRRLERAREFAAAFGAERAHEGVERLARDSGVDVVYVATPHVRHREDCLACLAAGRAVLVEKPFAVSAAEAAEVIDQAHRSQLFCMEAMWMRFHPLVQEVRDLVRSGALGTIRLLTAEFGYPTRFDPGNRFFDPAQGGGALLDRGVYLLSLAFFLLGRPDEAVGRAALSPTGVDEQETLLLGYRHGAQAVLTASLRSRLRNEALVIGTRGQVRLHDPFYVPHRITHTAFDEPSGPAAPSPVAPPGWKARIRQNPWVRRIVEAVRGTVPERLRTAGKARVHHRAGHGYQWEAVEVMRCLRAGLVESPMMPLDESLAILEVSDHLRQSWSASAIDGPGR